MLRHVGPTVTVFTIEKTEVLFTSKCIYYGSIFLAVIHPEMVLFLLEKSSRSNMFSKLQ